MNTFELTLDLDKSVGVKQWITLRQGDKRGTTLQATLYDHGVLVSGSYTCRVSIRHPNRNTYYRETATYSNGVATVTIDETSAASVVGVTEGYFELLQGSSVIASTESFGVRILQSATDGATVGPPYDSAIEDALDELDAATGRISQMVVDATAEYLAAHPEITTTVQDNSVTDAKLIQKGGVLDRVGRLWWRLENLLTATPAEAEIVTVGDAAKTPVAGLTVFGKSVQDGTPTPDAPVAIESVEGNLIRTDYYKSNSDGIPVAEWVDHTISGIRWVRNADGSLTARGTATGNSTCYLLLNHELPAGTTVAMTGCPAGGSTSTYAMLLCSTDNANLSMAIDKGTGVTTTTTKAANRVRCLVYGGATVDVTFKPMLVTAPQLMPYVPNGSAGLWARGRNLARSHLTDTYTYNGITWTYAGDDKWSATGSTGSATSSNQWTTYLLGVLPAGDYTVTMTPLSGTITGAGLAIAYRTGAGGQTAGRILGVSSGGRVTCTLTADGTSFYWLQPYIRENTTVNNLVLGVQVEVGSATAFTPYAESVTAIPLDGHVLRSLPDGTRDEVTVDQYGHAILTQRVGETTLGEVTSVTGFTSSENLVRFYVVVSGQSATTEMTASANVGMCNLGAYEPQSGLGNGLPHFYAYNNRVYAVLPPGTVATSSEAVTWINTHPLTIIYKLATPVTHDLGTIDPTALVGPDLTAQAVPTAPFALTYERDLNATLARLEAAIADAATA